VALRRALVPLVLATLAGCLMERVPARHRGPPPPEERRDLLATTLAMHVHALATEIGPRSYLAPKGLARAEAYVARQLSAFEHPPTTRARRLTYRASELPAERRGHCVKPTCTPELRSQGEVDATLPSIEFANLELELRGRTRPNEVVVIGAHYDSDACESGGCNPAADDNATGVAAMIELARRFHATPLARTVRFVAFTNEEEPFFQTEQMGSAVYARQSLAPGEQVVAMLSLETMGYFSDAEGSQQAPWPTGTLYRLPTVGNFIAFVSDHRSEALMHTALDAFDATTRFPAEGILSYAWVPGVDWSDHWAYWRDGVPALMVTDTAPNRNLCYHKPCDTADRLDFGRMARVVGGLAGVVETIAGR
jgi:hypothetical protein